MTSYRMHGISDDTDTCEICGKVELRRVVMLQVLDADGNPEELIYAGTTCAARKLAKSGTRTTAAKVRDAAGDAARVWEQARAYVAEMDGITFGRYMMANRVAADNASQREGFRRTALEIAREWHADSMAEVAAIKSGTLAGTRWERKLPTL
jgi:hypothetical protein